MSQSSRLPLSRKALLLDVLQQLPAPGGLKIEFKDLNGLRTGTPGTTSVPWVEMPASCDPVFILDNPANNIRRKGDLEQQLSQMILGRPGEASQVVTAATPTITTTTTTTRGALKRWQVESFAVVLGHLLHNPRRPLHVVDFGCGTGTLLLPLAVLFPHCTFTGVEMKPAAVALLQERARAAGLTNVTARRCMIEDFLQQPFDVALALHACGNATDAALQLASRRRAAYVVSPCCVGKLKFSLAGGSSFSASVHTYTPRLPGERRAGSSLTEAAAASYAVGEGGAGTADAESGDGGAHAAAASSLQGRMAEGSGEGAPGADGSWAEGGELHDHVVLGQIRHPRSRWMREKLPDPEAHFRIMAKVADQNHSGPSAAVLGGQCLRGGADAAVAARLCKAHVELDRNLAAVEESYVTGLFKCLHWEEMAKSDLIVGVPCDRSEWFGFAEALQRCPSHALR